MATRYLLTCPCEREIPVEPGQAGERVICTCGNELPVPKLGELRLLPRIETAEQVSTTWSGRHRVITVAGLVAAIGLGIGAYYWAITPARQDYDASPEVAEFEAYMDSRNPVQTWYYWLSQTVPIAEQGLQEHSTRHSVEFEQEIERLTKRQRIALSIGGLAAFVCIAAVLWPKA